MIQPDYMECCANCLHCLLPFGNSLKGYCKPLATTVEVTFGCVKHEAKV